MTPKEHIDQELKDLKVYIHWYSLQLYYKYSNNWNNHVSKSNISFEDFKTTLAHPTKNYHGSGKTLLEDWRWRHNFK